MPDSAAFMIRRLEFAAEKKGTKSNTGSRGLSSGRAGKRY
jgi:hypothetical protein